MNNRIQLLENRERNALERIEELELHVHILMKDASELRSKMIEKDAQISNIQKAYQHIMDRIATVPFEGKIVGFEAKE